MAPMHVMKVVEAFHEPHEFRPLALIKIGIGLPQSKTLSRRSTARGGWQGQGEGHPVRRI